MVVRDEEARLRRCLESVDGLVDEIVAVDTGSTDGTVALARALGATVIEHDFAPVDFSAARNRGLDAARGRYILVLDADEVLVPASAHRIRTLVSHRENVGWILTRRNIPDGVPDGVPDGAVGRAWTDHVVRVFPNHPQVRFRNRVHETIDQAILDGGGRLRRSGLVIDHHLPATAALHEKWRWYVELVQRDLTQAPEDVDRLVFLMADFYKLGRVEEATAVAERIATLCPGDFTSQLQAALCTFMFGQDPSRAHGYLSAARRIRPSDPEVLQLSAVVAAGCDLTERTRSAAGYVLR
jgi:glycosyltransferase involved in cell wall biosynthesis